MARRIQRRLTSHRTAKIIVVVLAAWLSACTSSVSLAQAPAASPSNKQVTDSIDLVNERISAQTMREQLTFLASDELEGRGTPSVGLNKAADFIAEQFQRMGLEPVSGDSYFQTAMLDEFGEAGVQLRNRYPDAPDFMHNVAGILRGSDPELRNTYVIVSAHYDHIGIGGDGEDRIYNGANDDGSGTVSVLAIAEALSTLPEAPKRSILFLTFFGEERGLLGSRYYGANPLVPLAQTVAEINLEHMGRTDMDGGTIERAANVTGFDFSTLTQTIVNSAALVDISITKNEQYSDPFFNQSDNRSLAMAGVPAHTISVGYLFPDYHEPSDTADKIDYENMAAVDRAVALAVLQLASSEQVPGWNASLPAASAYLEAAELLHAGE